MNFGSKVTKKNGKTFSSRCKYNQRKEKIQPEEKKYSQRKIFGQKISAKPKFTWTNELYYIISVISRRTASVVAQISAAMSLSR